ncbi:guanine nucleotide-binding protein subunit beta-like protein [Anaeramoeba ignava]|uniref:Guanine nucleotide-binding protein subunit beta-like protein n=1 Tax=Anaeramoeba ignava TaxID=1746090 RepID=A0A9Q0LNC2_ANAIG|nr:guanine nucleotide-binding protein subunit beta-like protein [Anaeramoeba ignava]
MKKTHKQIPQPIRVYRGHSESISSVRFISDNTIFASGSNDGEIRIWKSQSNQLVSIINSNSKKGILHIEKIDSSSFATQSRDGVIKLWNCENSDFISNFEFQTNSKFSFCKFSLSLDFSSLAIPSENPDEIELFDFKSGKKISKMQTEKSGMCMTLGFLKDQLFAGFENGKLYGFDTRMLSEDFIQPVSSLSCFEQPFLSLAISQKYETIFTGSVDPKFLLVQVSSENISQKDPFSDEKGGLILKDEIQLGHEGTSEICLRNDDQIFAFCGWDKRIRVFQFKNKTPKPLAILKFHTETVNSIHFSEDLLNGYLLAGSKDKKITLWQLYPKRKK